MGLSAYDAAIAVSYSARYARTLASLAEEPTPKALINLAWEQMHDKKCPERVRQRYWEKLGEHLGLWGPGRRPPAAPDEEEKPEPFVVRDVAKEWPHNGEEAEE